MKIRWAEGSLRYRISPSELQMLLDNQVVIESLGTLNGAWTAGLQVTDGGSELIANGPCVTVLISKVDLQELMVLASEGVYFKTPEGFQYYIEKDFPCVYPSAIEAELSTAETFPPTEGFEQRKRS